MHHLVIYSFLYIVYTSTMGMFHTKFNYCWQTIGGGQTKKIPQYSKYNLFIKFLFMPRYKRLQNYSLNDSLEEKHTFLKLFAVNQFGLV